MGKAAVPGIDTDTPQGGLNNQRLIFLDQTGFVHDPGDDENNDSNKNSYEIGRVESNRDKRTMILSLEQILSE